MFVSLHRTRLLWYLKCARSLAPGASRGFAFAIKA
jgi:hypothetical protein